MLAPDMVTGWGLVEPAGAPKARTLERTARYDEVRAVDWRMGSSTQPVGRHVVSLLPKEGGLSNYLLQTRQINSGTRARCRA